MQYMSLKLANCSISYLKYNGDDVKQNWVICAGGSCGHLYDDSMFFD